MKVFKYSGVNEHSIANLKNYELWFSNPLKFEDQNDSNLPIIESEIPAIKERLLEDIKNLSPEQLKSLKPPEGFFDNLKATDHGSMTIASRSRDFRNSFIGITCFTVSEGNPRMWEKFGEQGKGFCLCFETSSDTDFFKDIRYVKYQSSLPVMNFATKNHAEVLEIFYTTKLNQFSWEEELRLVRMKQGPIKYNKESLIEIILGPKISNQHKILIQNLIENNYTGTPIREL